ncbi:hypothetical protein [Vibrio quintilis]|uniref:CN hydrolase domain-containing protein n=1 Tax=Vibrio quintilis TaxID=1117707 RepID=A0A1M7YRD7_9VIBR|nr:hypothetical protein [Vibrio quintilis]SHO55199.1 hypothetical protein VQ7734_00918 [Vibrio quintilis]
MKKFISLFFVIMISSGCAAQHGNTSTVTSTAAGGSPEPARSDRGTSEPQILADLPELKIADHLGQRSMKHFPTYAQCQIQFTAPEHTEDGLTIAESKVLKKLNRCLETAVSQHVDVLIFPELSLGTRASERATFVAKLKATVLKENMIIIAGSFYDKERQSRIPVIGPGWTEYGFKVRPSRFEASPRSGFGMKPGDNLLLVKTEFGRIMPLTCVDLISDGAQYVVRNLANQRQIDVLTNINFNPASWEFLIEANSLVRRHPIFVSITNVASYGATYQRCQQKDYGYCAGNSAIFASLRTKPTDCPNCFTAIKGLIEPQFMQNKDRRHTAYDRLAGVVPALKEGMLIYDLNLRLIREPLSTNAPDQGYPPVRNLRRILF